MYYYSHPFYGDSSQYNGNLVGQKIAISGDPAFTYLYSYDWRDQLKSAYLCEAQTMLEQFGYDLNGNRLTYVQDGRGTRDYSYESGTNRLSEIIGSVDSLDNTFSYDENGNVKTDQAKNATFAYDVYNQLETVVIAGAYGDNTLTFGYNNAGERILKRYHYYYRVLCDKQRPPNNAVDGFVEPGRGDPHSEENAYRYDEPETSLEAVAKYCTYEAEVETHYVRGSGGKVLAEYLLSSTGTYSLRRKYIYAGDQRIAMVDADGKVFFYLNDHLGSARVVVREQSKPDEDPVADKYSEYWAFGADADITVQTGQPYKYTGKPFDNEGGLDLYYYGARYYDAGDGRFMAVDPLAGKYPSLSPYVYCANNPLKFVDPDGERLEMAPGQTREFQDKFAASIQHMNKHGNGGTYADLQEKETVVWITETGNDSEYKKSTNVIYWNPNQGLIPSGDGKGISATTILLHEGAHALREITDPQGQDADQSTPDPQYGNREEKRVVEQVETPAARKANEGTRTDHKGKMVPVTDPTEVPQEVK